MASENNLHTSFDEHESDSLGFPGHILRNAREEKGLSKDQVLRNLYFMRSVIDDLENGDFSRITTPVFARGYIRSYGRYLGVDVDALLSAYDAEIGDKESINRPIVMPKEIIAKHQTHHPSDIWVKAIGAFLLVLIVGGSWWWWQSQDGAPVDARVSTEQNTAGIDGNDVLLGEVTQFSALTNGSELSVPSSAPNITDPDAQVASIATTNIDTQTTTPLDAEDVEQNDVGSVDSTDVVDTTDANTATTKDVASNNAQDAKLPTAGVAGVTSNTSNNAEAPTLVAEGSRLFVSFNDNCWVEIRDSQDNIITSRVYSKFETIDQVMQTPVKVLLGRFSAIEQFTLNSQAIDLAPHTRKDIVRITLAP